jgi:ankyrin repeat protein
LNPPHPFDSVHIAATNPSDHILKYILDEDPTLVTKIDNFQSKAQPIHYASQAKSVECIKLLRRLKADMNAKDSEGNTPMHCAVNS